MTRVAQRAGRDTATAIITAKAVDQHRRSEIDLTAHRDQRTNVVKESAQCRAVTRGRDSARYRATAGRAATALAGPIWDQIYPDQAPSILDAARLLTILTLAGLH